MAAALVAAQSQDTINATQGQRVTDVDRRLQWLEDGNILTRLAVLEAGMGEIKWLVRAVAAHAVGQLLISVMDRRRRTAANG